MSGYAKVTLGNTTFYIGKNHTGAVLQEVVTRASNGRTNNELLLMQMSDFVAVDNRLAKCRMNVEDLLDMALGIE